MIILAYWKQLNGIQQPIAIRQFTGIDKQEAFSIADGAATNLKNLTSSSYPALTVRPGFTNLGASLAAAVVGLGVWKDIELHAVANGNWVKWTGATWSAALASGLSTSARWSFCNFQGNFAQIDLLGINGVVAKKYDGATVAALANVPAGGNYIDAHDNRVYVAVASRVWASGFRNAENWTTGDLDTDAWWGEVETPDGRDIIGMKAGPGHITVFKPYHTFELFGTGSLNYRLQPVSDKIGCVSNASAIMVGGVMYWLSNRGIEKYAGGVAPKNDWSFPVQYYADNINASNKSKACAGTDGKRLYMALPLLTATEPSHVIEYDPRYGTFYVWELPHYPRLFAYMAESWYNGDSAGQVHLMGGTTDAGTAITWESVSKPFGGGTLAQKQDWYDMWLVCDLPTGSTLNVYLSKLAEGDTDWVLVKAMTVNADIQSARVIIPVNTVANANWVRVKFSGTGSCTIYEWDRQMRLLPYV